MAINIFQGVKKAANRAANSLRAKFSQSALGAPAAVSDSGGTAVATQGVMGKVINGVNKISGFVSKVAPGAVGGIAKLINKLTGNDPEWWQSVPGDPITLNNPLRVLVLDEAGDAEESKLVYARAAIGEFVSLNTTNVLDYVMVPTDQMITQYLMPEIRKVVNAVPLQAAWDYRVVLSAHATMYAMWRNLRKYDYLLKHGMAYMPNLNDPAFPVLQVENASWLQATINRLEEYLRSNVRIPHTLCEYLAWRYGRVYRSSNSAKAGLIMYNVIPLSSEIEDYNRVIQQLMNVVSSQVEYQKANTDLYNTYYNHDMQVVIQDDTQCSWDAKEFLLRTNSDIAGPTGGPVGNYNDTPDIVFINADMDNPTCFMASTVSTRTLADDGTVTILFPVDRAFAYTAAAFENDAFYYVYNRATTDPASGLSNVQVTGDAVNGSTIWHETPIHTFRPAYNGTSWEIDQVARVLNTVIACKALDIYNKNVYWGIARLDKETTTFDSDYVIDLTTISLDSGLVEATTLRTEHVYAFANLVNIERHHSMSYGKAEKMVAKETANMIESLDVATAADPAPSTTRT